MSDSPSNPLTEQALKRLRALANGNGIAPDSITLVQGEEKTYTLEGVMTLTPLTDVQSRQYLGRPNAKGAQVLADVEALRQEVKRRQNEFREHPSWVAEVKEELKTAPGGGWGLDGAKITLAKRAAVLAATTVCPQCRGGKMIPCATCQSRGFEPCFQCRSQRQEICYNCNGSGQNPAQQGQPCPICQGSTRILCRRCRGTGQVPCRTCGGKRGTPCPACKGGGQVSEEAHLSFGATTHFQLKPGSVLPSGLRRGLDRLGIANLAKGYADIQTVEPKEEEREESEALLTDEDLAKLKPAESKPAPKPAGPALMFEAQLPFAELRMDFAGKKAVVSVFGKRASLVDVPTFLDDTLGPARSKLTAAAQGGESLKEAIKARAVRDALALQLQGKGNIKEFRRLYPVGLSAKTGDEIVINIRKAIKQTTLRIRIAVAIVFGLVSAGIFAGCYFTSLPAQLAGGPRWMQWALDFVPLLTTEGLGWAGMNAAMRFVLQKNFPDMKIAYSHTPSKTGYLMMAGIFVVWIAILMLSPARPAWLPFVAH